ncbi:unnamed protein product [Paramecium sonneborni]|uniref:C2H2-type domain-containing protein n=1 Tax=Paramecium sonneborni TaxID=65129 RepID=A0A8S1RN36_9CILI|nr:unnamed protein product [Paramecium sonneborni]
MNIKEMHNQERDKKPQQIIKCLKIVELLKMLYAEINYLDVEQKNEFLDDFIEQCLKGSLDDSKSDCSLFLNHYITKRGNGCTIRNGHKVFECQKCQETFKTHQILGNHTSKSHRKFQKINKSIKKF